MSQGCPHVAGCPECKATLTRLELAEAIVKTFVIAVSEAAHCARVPARIRAECKAAIKTWREADL